MSGAWSTWHCEKCQIILPFKSGMENYKCTGCEIKAENAKLRDQLRWRKWPEEKPEVEQHCQLILAGNSFPHLCCSIYPFAHWENLNVRYWRPIGKLPGGE